MECGALFPERLRCQLRPLRQRLKLGPRNLRMDATSEAAVAAGNDVLAPDHIGEALDAIGDQFRMLDEMDRPALRSDLIKWGAANTAFHLRMATISGLPLVQDQLRVAFDHWERIRLHLFQAASPQRVTLAQEEHREIVDALKRRSGARLATLLRTHNQAARDAYLRLLK